MLVSDVYICDEPEVRYVQLVEVTLSHCASVLWPTRPERVAHAAVQAAQLREVLQRRTAAAEAADANTTRATTACHAVTSSTHHADARAQHDGVDGRCVTATTTTTTTAVRKTMPKHGQNGLCVVSVDTILCKRDVHACTTTTTTTTTTACPGDGDKHSSSRNGSAEGVVCEGNGQATTTTTTTAAAAPTPATTQSGDVVLVSETGSPLLEHVCTSPPLPLCVRRLSGGITNELFHIYDGTCAYDDEDNNNNNNDTNTTRQLTAPSVVIRVFGKETERVISRESELFYQSLFLRTYVHGVNFLVYEYLPAHAVLPYTDMPREVHAIADVLAGFQVHATRAARRDVVMAAAAAEEATTTRSSVAASSDNDRRRCSRFDREDNYTLHALTTWVEQAASAAIVAKVQPDKRDAFVRLVRQLADECAWMHALLQRPALAAALGEGVCHNDLLSANIMRHTTTHALTIIDFDYTKRNYLLFDVANHFNEYTGLECDYARYFPSDAHMAVFLMQYRRAMRRHLVRVHTARKREEQQQQQQRPCNGYTAHKRNDNDDADEHDDDVLMLSSSYDTYCGSNDEVFAGERALFWSDSATAESATVQHWTQLVKLLTLASHLSWSVWSLLQESVSALDVDFLSYAELRYARYASTKHAFACDMC